MCISCKVRKVQFPRDLADLKPRIIAAVKNINAPMLMRVWQEVEYRIAVCRVTCGAHIVSLCAMSPVVHTSNMSSCQQKIQFSCVCEQFH